MGILRGFCILLASLMASSCAVTNFNSYSSSDEIKIKSILIKSLAASYREAIVQEKEFCDTLDAESVVCSTTEGHRKPGLEFSEKDTSSLVKNQKFGHILLVGLISSEAKNEPLVIQTGNQSQVINTVTESKIFSIQLVSVLSNAILYSAEVETQYGETTTDFQKRRFYGQMFDRVIEDWESKGFYSK